MLQTVLTAIVLVSTVCTFAFLRRPTRYHLPIPITSQSIDTERRSATETAEVSIQVVVLGDIGRSPRMQYHALSIAKNGGFVQLVCYRGTLKHINLSAIFLALIFHLRELRAILASAMLLTLPVTQILSLILI